MTIAIVLPHRADPAAPLLRDLFAPLREAGGRLELWLSGPPAGPPALPEPEPVCFDGLGGPWNILTAGDRLRRLERLWVERRPDLIALPGTPAGHELAARLSARLNCGCFPETRVLIRDGKRLFARRKVCGSNLDGDAEITDFPAILTVAGKRAAPGGGSPEVLPPEPAGLPALPVLPEWILEYERAESFPANPLETAPLIFAAGRGVGSKAACDRLRRVAGRFGAPLGFSRPAALNGWGEIAGIIGQSGVRAGAEVCVAVGVSGAAAFMAGIESASTLIAVNPDKNAPIFQYADVGIAAGAEEFIAALEAEIEKPQGNQH